MTALVSFERVFEVLDLEPLITERPDAVAVPQGPVSVELDDVHFSYPSADKVSLASLEEVATRLAVSVNTVKTHLKQVYAKTGAGGRADLVRLTLGLATAH